MRNSVLSSLFALSVSLSVAAQSNSGVVVVGYDEAGQHNVEPRHTWVRVPKPSRGMPQLRLTLTISPQGDVVHAEAHGNVEEMLAWPAAQSTVYGWKYRPFLRDGQAVTAMVQSGISFMPLEVAPKVVEEPTLRADSKIVISLQRTACYGSCPAYTVTLSKQEVLYEGDRFGAIAGTHRASLPEQGVVGVLAQRMLDAGWFGMEDKYHANWTDNPTQTVTLTVDGKTKTVIDYVGIEAGMPDAVRDIEYEIDRTAGSARWVHAASGVASLLRAEGFNFGSFVGQNVLRTAASQGDVSSVRELLAAGVPRERVAKPVENPVWGRGWSGFDGLLTAAARQPEVLQVMMQAGVSSQDTVDKNVALAAAVTAGNVESSRLLLQYGADANMNFAALREQTDASAYWIKDSSGLLVNATESGDPETLRLILSQIPLKERQTSLAKGLLVDLAATGNAEQSDRRAECARMLLDAGADVHATDNRGRTALHVAQGLPLVAVLVQAGANVNAQDFDGNTPAFSTYAPDTFRFLAAHGADLIIRNHAGQTATENPHRYAPEWAPVYAEVRAGQASQ
jgi:hypothetical protein